MIVFHLKVKSRNLCKKLLLNRHLSLLVFFLCCSCFNDLHIYNLRAQKNLFIKKKKHGVQFQPDLCVKDKNKKEPEHFVLVIG